MYFQVHQPRRLRKYQVFDIGVRHDYFDDHKNKEILKKVSSRCYLPANRIILDLIKKYDFKVAFSITGTALEQFEKYAPEVLDSFKELAKTGNVEFLAETYYHSLSYIYSREEFDRQLDMHIAKVKKLSGKRPAVFRNTELIFNNELAAYIEKKGFQAVLSEGADHILGWKSPNYVYSPSGTKKIKLLVKNYKLSDDIAFRFSNKRWEEFPLTPEKFTTWLNDSNGEIINLFMDYETFGEHQWKESGIFDFLEKFPREFVKTPENKFMMPSDVLKAYRSRGEIDMPGFVSWADADRDLSAWLGNPMQDNAIKELYMIEKAVKETKDKKLIDDWSNLTTSDHFYYMCTKFSDDGSVHNYFNPYDSPYEGFIAFMNILNDIILRIKGINPDGLNISERPSEMLAAQK